MQVAMDQRLRLAQELQLVLLRRPFPRPVGAHRSGGDVELRAGPAVALGHAPRIGEDQILGDPAELCIVAEQRHVLFLRGGGLAEVGGREQRLGHEGRHVVGELWIDRAADQALAQDDVRVEVGHHGERQRLVEMEELGHVRRYHRALRTERLMLEEGATHRQRPALTDQPHIGQRLLQHHAALGPFDHEDQVEIAVAHFADLPVRRLAAEVGRNSRNARQIGGDIGFLEGPIAGRNVERHGRERRASGG